MTPYLKIFILSFCIFFSYLEANNDDDKLISKNFANLSIKDMFINQDSLDSEDLFEVQMYESKILLAETLYCFPPV